MFSSLFSPGYWLAISKLGSPIFKHRLCGHDDLKEAVSPNSGRPLLQMVRLDTSDERLGLDKTGVPFFYLLFSWTCDISQGPFAYQQDRAAISILSCTKGEAYTDFPWIGYPDEFPGKPLDLVQITDHEQKVLRQANQTAGDQRFLLLEENRGLAVPRHQVGGEPLLLGGGYLPSTCPKCGTAMRFLASTGNDNGESEHGFCGNDFVQVVFELCLNCRVVMANQFAD